MERKNCEAIQLVIKKARKESKLEENEQKVLSDLKELDFGNNFDTNKNYLLNYILDFFEKKGYFFLLISLLKNEFSKKFLDALNKQCTILEDDKFLSEFDVFLNEILQCEKAGKEFLISSQNSSFSDVFFSHNYGNNSDLHGSLNINFTEHTQCLNVNATFEEPEKLSPNKSKLKKLILYDNGHKSVVIEKNSDKTNYLLTQDCSCQFIIKRFNQNDSYTIIIDITSGEVINAELKINDTNANSLKILNLISSSDEKILIKDQSLSEILISYFDNEREQGGDCEHLQSECLPIKSLNDLINWKPPPVKHITSPLRKRVKDENGIKTLVCHDMKGGYLEDRYINGANEENCFFFVHWAAVDIFGYFSHHLVSIPPCSWISAAHINGVQVIGTFITEWDEGVEVFENVFTDKKSVQELCMQLVNIATYYNFDGWLINIENEVKPYQIPLLKYFVKSLTTKMHAYIPGSQVIWYDSVLKNGDLLWQNCLNDLNRLFFLNADAIFLDYHWNEEKLLLSKLQACDRGTDVYVGVDVFGRGKCFTEGGFSTEISVKEVRKHGLSVGIFAPGWVYECLEMKDFKENQFKFWGPLQDLIPPRVIEDLPYCSSFCPGFGNKMFRNGKVIDDKPWHNMNLQQPQPVYYSSTECSLSLYNDDAFNGGGCLCLSGNIINEEKTLEFNILKTSFCLENTCLVSYTFKPLVLNVDIGLCLSMISGQGTYKLHLLDLNNKKYSGSNSSLKCLTPAPLEQLLKTGYRVDQESFEQQTWIKRTYLLNLDDFSYHSIQNISVVAYCNKPLDESVSILFGELEVLPVYPIYNLMYEDLTCKYISDDSSMIEVECVLKWRHHSSTFCSDIYVQPLNEDKKFICTTNQSFYMIKCSIKSASEITVMLCPKTAGSEKLPIASIKIPLKM